jgi:hypothetical protein
VAGWADPEDYHFWIAMCSAQGVAIEHPEWSDEYIERLARQVYESGRKARKARKAAATNAKHE